MYVAGLFFFRQREIQAGTVDCNKMGRVSGKNYRAHRLFDYNQLTPMIFKLFFEKVTSKRKESSLGGNLLGIPFWILFVFDGVFFLVFFQACLVAILLLQHMIQMLLQLFLSFSGIV